MFDPRRVASFVQILLDVKLMFLVEIVQSLVTLPIRRGGSVDGEPIVAPQSFFPKNHGSLGLIHSY